MCEGGVCEGVCVKGGCEVGGLQRLRGMVPQAIIAGTF